MGKRNNETLIERKKRAREELVQLKFIAEMNMANIFQNIDKGLDGITKDVILPHNKILYLTIAYKHLASIQTIVLLSTVYTIGHIISGLDDNTMIKNNKLIIPPNDDLETLHKSAEKIKNFLNIAAEEIHSTNTKIDYTELVLNGLNNINTMCTQVFNKIEQIQEEF